MALRMKSLFAGAVAAAVVSILPAAAQTTPAATLGEVIQRIRQDSQEQSAEAQRRLQEFTAARNNQAAELARAQAELDALIAEGERLQALFDQNDARIVELQDELRAGQGDFGELFGVARQAALDATGAINTSIISAQPGTFVTEDGETTLLDRLQSMSSTDRMPTQLELDAVWKALIEEAIHQREVVRFTARVGNIGPGGVSEDAEVVRIGPFSMWAMDGGAARFVEYEEGQITVLPRQPSQAFRNAAANVARTSPDRLVAGPIDPSRGTLLGLVVETPTFMETVQFGGFVGYATLTLAAVAGVFGILRFVQLSGVAGAINRQARNPSRPSKNNPLGRVMLAAQEASGADIETFELRLDEAIVKETGAFDFGLNFVKLTAGVCTLLGLLGTVTGMIQVFQQITLFGTGDPRTMAGGISQALVTTVIGLVCAIPLVFIHSFGASAAKGAKDTIEEQAAGIIARHAESRRAG